jgi:hypothetical protein
MNDRSYGKIILLKKDGVSAQAFDIRKDLKIGRSFLRTFSLPFDLPFIC